MVLIATGLDDDRCNGGSSERALNLTLGIASWEFFFFSQTRL
jgi:hypothetical protein